MLSVFTFTVFIWCYHLVRIMTSTVGYRDKEFIKIKINLALMWYLNQSTLCSFFKTALLVVLKKDWITFWSLLNFLQETVVIRTDFLALFCSDHSPIIFTTVLKVTREKKICGNSINLYSLIMNALTKKIICQSSWEFFIRTASEVIKFSENI